MGSRISARVCKDATRIHYVIAHGQPGGGEFSQQMANGRTFSQKWHRQILTKNQLTSRKEKLLGSVLTAVFSGLNGPRNYLKGVFFILKFLMLCAETHIYMQAWVWYCHSLKMGKAEAANWQCLYRRGLTSWFCDLLDALKVISRLESTVKRRELTGEEIVLRRAGMKV